jgi:hypothetical protein
MNTERIIRSILKKAKQEVKIFYNGDSWLSEKIKYDFPNKRWTIDDRRGDNLIRQNKQHLIHDLEKINFKVVE